MIILTRADKSLLAFGILAELFCVHPQLNVMTAMFREVFFITTVVFNGFVTLAIAYKIARVMRDMGRYGHGNASVESRAGAVALILTESAMVYTIVGVAVIFTFKSKDPSALVLGTTFQSLSVSIMSASSMVSVSDTRY
jgi:hypothetical protein